MVRYRQGGQYPGTNLADDDDLMKWWLNDTFTLGKVTSIDPIKKSAQILFEDDTQSKIPWRDIFIS